MVVGKLVESAVTGLKQTLLGSGLLRENFTNTDFTDACANYIARFGPLKASATYQPPPNVYWDDEKYQGDAYGAYAWAVYVAEVSFDELTYEARVEDFVALQEIGRVLNPVLAAGQIEGGVAQAIGFTLFENVVWKDGRMANNQMTNYIIPTPADIRFAFSSRRTRTRTDQAAQKESANYRWTAPHPRSSMPSRMPQA